MLSSLHIRNYILINSLDISFPEGLVIITGQTGAGKSILLGALSLLSGARADASVLSQGADSCVVEAAFSVDDPLVDDILAESDIESEGNELLIRRVVSASGRSRSFINDCPVQVGVLQAISARLIDIHSQHRSLVLTDKNFQLSMLDHYAGNGPVLAECRNAWEELGSIRKELSAAREQLDRSNSEREYNEAQFSQLEAARLKSGELESLEEEHKALSNAGQIKESLMRASECFAPSGDTVGVLASLREVEKELSHTVRFLPALDPLVSRVESARLELEDIASEIDDIDGRVDVSSGRLETVEQRMSDLYSLLKKNHCTTVDELIARRDELSALLYDSSALEDRIRLLEKRENAVGKVYSDLCERLSASRTGRADAFAADIQESLRSLEIERATFTVDVSPASDSRTGRDKVVFMFSSTGAAPVDLTDCASGGEMSRIMLCLKAMMARFTGMPTLIFDEIDTGVSGSVADKMGRMICDMGRDMQVLSITHLPQVAAKGNAHYVVSKTVQEDGTTVSSLHKLSDEERVKEIARLLSGSIITEAAISNARELLLQSGC